MARAGLVAGNWKMHGNLIRNQELLASIVSGTQSLQNVSCAVCVPYPYLAQAQLVLGGTHVEWGGQNVSQHHQGAYTGEISAGMLADFGCRYVIVGHSERRTLYGEGNKVVAEKFCSAQERLLVPILCVGETLAQREANDTEQVIAMQLDAVIDFAGIDAIRQSVIAYEPVWAIGTGKTATPQQAQDVHAFIRNRIASHNDEIAADIQIIYGGSVKADNASELFAMADIDGGLIGGASLVASEFISICFAAQG
ncbi:triose-phosphate isomerase [Nitrosomonas sp. HPC101]|uniref:triose-phosphate isomerase n=1 Tax=Nitrosomonas sp. HPC101 TaxID=1658667 RepID=UPI00136C14B2|nr:triose-phosphate isomerase [Nitrosomonas sp. HPC101]MXS84685.1 triose-phosphate isomerase [Nitrosomonas sp. HPC101]